MFPERDIPASVRLTQLMDLLPGIPAGTVVTEKEIMHAIKDYIQKLEKAASTEPERLCRCCEKPKSEWIQNDDLAYAYVGDGICQACESIADWAENSPAKLELVAAYLCLLKKQQEAQ